MAVTVTPEALVPGDIVRIEGAVWRIEMIADNRVHNPLYGADFEITATHCRTGDSRGFVLGPSALLTRLEPLRRRDIEGEINELHPGDTLAITYWDMGFWA